MGNTSCFHVKSPTNNKYHISEGNSKHEVSSSHLPLENLSFYAQKGGDDGYFAPTEISYYSQSIENRMKELVCSLQEKNISWKPGEYLGQGSYASVIMGFNEETGQIMAVKQVVSSMKLEIDLLSRLEHKNIVSYIGANTQKKVLNIFLEYIAGGSISSLIHKYGRLNENIVRIYTRQILQGLEYLHWNGVAHRDIKGANVLVDTSGVCKLTDFGSCKNIRELCDHPTLTGTANWMAPEVIKQTGGGRFSDIWSVGCTVIEMLAGKPPWSEYGNPITTMFKIANGNGPPQMPDGIANETQDFLTQCFQIEPKKRMNCYRLLRHPFLTGNVPLLRVPNGKRTALPNENTNNANNKTNNNNGNNPGGLIEQRKKKKLLSAIPEKEETPRDRTNQELIIKEVDEEEDERGGQILSLTKLENEMVMSIVESDDKANINLKRYSDEESSFIYRNSFLTELNVHNLNVQSNNAPLKESISMNGSSNVMDEFYFCNENDFKNMKMDYSFKVIHLKSPK